MNPPIVSIWLERFRGSQKEDECGSLSTQSSLDSPEITTATSIKWMKWNCYRASLFSVSFYSEILNYQCRDVKTAYEVYTVFCEHCPNAIVIQMYCTYVQYIIKFFQEIQYNKLWLSPTQWEPRIWKRSSTSMDRKIIQNIFYEIAQHVNDMRQQQQDERGNVVAEFGRDLLYWMFWVLNVWLITRLSRRRVCFGSSPTPSPVSKPDRRHTGRLRKRDNSLTGEWGGGERRGWGSQIKRRQESLVLYKDYKSFTIISLLYAFWLHTKKFNSAAVQ
jgi:hypothetical protein